MSPFLTRSLLAVSATAGLLACDSTDRPAVTETSALAAHRDTPTLTSQPAQAHLAAGIRGTLTPVLSVGDTLPDGAPWAPIPDGLGAYADWRKLVLFVNHELNSGGGRRRAMTAGSVR